MKIKGYEVRVRVMSGDSGKRWVYLRRTGGRPLTQRRAQRWADAWHALGYPAHADMVN